MHESRRDRKARWVDVLGSVSIYKTKFMHILQLSLNHTSCIVVSPGYAAGNKISFTTRLPHISAISSTQRDLLYKLSSPISVATTISPTQWGLGDPSELSFPASHSSAAPRSGSHPQKEHPPSLYQAAPRSSSSPSSSPRSSLIPPSIKQPRAAAAPPERASSLPLSSSPEQQQLPQQLPQKPLLRSFNQAAPRSGSSPRKSLLPSSIKQPSAHAAPQERASSLPLSSSPELVSVCVCERERERES